MVSKYIKRDFTDHIQTTEYISDEDEYIKFEIFSFDPVFTQTYVVADGSLNGENADRTNFRGWICCQSNDKINPMEFTLNYNAKDTGLYRIDFLYEKNDLMYGDGDYKLYNTGKDLTGWYDIYAVDAHSEHKAKELTPAAINDKTPKSVKKAMEKAIKKANEKVIGKPSGGTALKFEGTRNAIKRKTIYKNLNKDKYKIEFSVPHNCYVYGAIIRKIKKFWGTNNDEPGSNLQFTEATLTNSEMGKPVELKCTIGYDDSFECKDNRSGLYMEYMDECNLYVRNNEGKIVRKFGGYVSTPLPDNDRKKLTIHCADRLKDGENKYILDQLLLQHGDGSASDYERAISFNKHGEVLSYICKSYECTLNNNLDGQYHVQGEKYSASFDITFGKKKKIKKISVINGQATTNKNSITLRNNSDGKKKQIFKLYKPKKAVNISQYESVDEKTGEKLGLNLHITFGLGNVKTDHKIKRTNTVDVGGSVAGSQKFSPCGLSQDKKYVMAIGTVSSAKDDGSYGTYYKTVFKNKCPHCGSDSLAWDSCRSDTKCIYTENWNGSKGSWGVAAIETEITCNSCDSDFSALGNEKDSPWKSLDKVGSTTRSSKEEQDKLHNGEMIALPDGKDASVSADDIFKAIKNACRGWTHSLGTGSTAGYLEDHGTGDCWAWSEWISNQLKKYKVNHKIMEYATSQADNHRSVLYQNENGEYVDFPYREYDFPQNARNTSASLSGHTYYHYNAGGRISQATTSGKTTKTETTEVTVTKGYDKNAPFQAYLDIVVGFGSDRTEAKSHKKHVYVDFTQKAKSANTISGLKPVWVNNASKKLTVKGFGERLYDYFGYRSKKIYLFSISFVTPVIKTTNKEKKTTWYTIDKSTQDNSSCKMMLYNIQFNSEGGTEPSDLQACGKSLNDLLKSTLNDAGYIMEMEYAEHRKNDKIYFKINNNNTESFVATEGNSNNILEWGNISYNPANELFNMSRCVFKKNTTNKYYYVESKDANSILKYQEQCTLMTENEGIGEKEAYWNARHNEKFNSEQTYSYTITVGGCPDLDLKDLVRITANRHQLNTLKEVDSITLKYNYKNKPVIQTELGLGELAPDLQIRKNIKKLRDNAKTQTTYFHKSATAEPNQDIYTWEY